MPLLLLFFNTRQSALGDTWYLEGALGLRTLPYLSPVPSSLPPLKEVYWQAAGGPKMPQAQGLPLLLLPYCLLIPAQPNYCQLVWTACLLKLNILTICKIKSTLLAL